MLYSLNRKQFAKNVLSSPYVWTDLIRDSEQFNSKYYFDETDVHYLATNYGSGETITVFSPFSEKELEKAKKFFPNAAGFCFACNYDDFDKKPVNTKYGMSFHYKNFDKVESKSSNLNIKKINSADKDDLQKYDNLYLSFLRENHGARLLNFWKYNENKLLNGDKELYLAWKENDLIGFCMVDIYKDLKACDIAQITIEKPFQKQGYGKQLLCSIVGTLRDQGCEVYYSSVESDNIASQKTAESAGFKPIAFRMTFAS